MYKKTPTGAKVCADPKNVYTSKFLKESTPTLRILSPVMLYINPANWKQNRQIQTNAELSNANKSGKESMSIFILKLLSVRYMQLARDIGHKNDAITNRMHSKSYLA